jgi:hypothetical protein
MAAVKQFIFEAAELAFMVEMSDQGRPEALKKWNEFVEKSLNKFGAEIESWIVDIFDDIADRSGEYWEVFAADSTFEELKALYTKSVA